MIDILKYLDKVIDIRQHKKVKHKIGDIIALVFFAPLSNVDDWVSVEIFGQEHQKYLQTLLELSNGIPSHDTIQCR